MPLRSRLRAKLRVQIMRRSIEATRRTANKICPMTAPVILILQNVNASLALFNFEHGAKGWVSRNGAAAVLCEQTRVDGPRVPHSRHALFTFFCRRLRCAFLAVNRPSHARFGSLGNDRRRRRVYLYSLFSEHATMSDRPTTCKPSCTPRDDTMIHIVGYGDLLRSSTAAEGPRGSRTT